MMINKQARETLTPLEMDRGDTFAFTLLDGRTVTMELLRTSVKVLRTNLKQFKVEQQHGRTDFQFTAEVRIDGHTMVLERECTTERTFYEPWVVSGMRLWFDAVDDLFEIMDETHGPCRPTKHARFAVQDATQRICPEVLHPWCPLAEEGLDPRECYDGDDCWMGAYFGASAHGGLDINHPRGTPLYTPLSIDVHRMYKRRGEAGALSSGWEGIHRWEDGSTWTLRSAHVGDIFAPFDKPLAAGTHYAAGAVTGVGFHDHSHFAFEVEQDGETTLLDPWILFWQMYQDRDHHPEHFYRRADTGVHQGRTDAPTGSGAGTAARA